MQLFQHEGIWWTPAEPGVRWVGKLLFHPRDGAVLSIIEPLNGVRSFSFGGGRTETYEVLHGRTTEGTAVSLLRSYERTSRMNLSGAGASRTREIGANALIMGLHADTDDPLVSSVRASVHHLGDWWWESGLALDSTVARPDLVVRYAAPEPLLLHDDGAFRVWLRAGATGHVGNRTANLRESVTFDVEAVAPQPLSAFQRRVRACADFLSVACLALCEIDKLEMETPETSEQSRERGTFHAVPIYRGRENNGPVGGHMLFRAHEFEARLPTLFASWWSHQEELFDVRALYVAGAYGGGFVEGRLLTLTQAVEAFHRRFRDGRYMDEDAFQRDVLPPILAAIPQAAGQRLRQSVAARLRYANEYSQRLRFRLLFRQYAAALETMVAQPTAYVDPIIDHRNEFTHFDPAVRTSPDDVSPERVLLYNFLLRMLLEACFLEIMGFSQDEIVTLLRRSETYRQLSVRFRPWAIETTTGTTKPAAAISEPAKRPSS
jgi:hypothetical protein